MPFTKHKSQEKWEFVPLTIEYSSVSVNSAVGNSTPSSMACPSCVMFESHKGHPVLPIEEGARSLRARINDAAKEGLLQFQHTENQLLELRHAKLSLEDNCRKMLNLAQTHFNQMSSAVQLRRRTFLEELRVFFSLQLAKLEEKEQLWSQKQEVSQRILQLQASPDDNKILQEALFINESLQSLSAGVEYLEVHLLSSLRTSARLSKSTLELQQIKEALRTLLDMGQQTVNRIRC